MLLSYGQKKEDCRDPEPVEQEEVHEIQRMIEDKKSSKQILKFPTAISPKKNTEINDISLSNSSQISRIDLQNDSVNISMKDSLKIEDFSEKDIIVEIEEDKKRKTNLVTGFNFYIDDDEVKDKTAEEVYNVNDSQNNKSKNSMFRYITMGSNNAINKTNNNNTNTSNSMSFTNCINCFISNKTEKTVINDEANNNDSNQIGFKTGMIGEDNHGEEISKNDWEKEYDNNVKNVLTNNVMSWNMNMNVNGSQLNNNQHWTSLTEHNLYNAEANSTNYISNCNYESPNIINYQVYQSPSQWELSNLLQSKLSMDLINNCIAWSKEQIGCRLLQKLIVENPSLAPQVFYHKIKNMLPELSCDHFSNYFIQKIIENISIDQIEEILKDKIPFQFRATCFNQYGTRVIQKIFERILSYPHLLQYYTVLLKPNLFDFMQNPYANHIVIKYVNNTPSSENSFIIDYISNNVIELATKKHSCCTLQKCMEGLTDPQLHNLWMVIAQTSYNWFTDQYGNYVVQFAILKNDYEVMWEILRNLMRNFISFANQKYSSTVIEKLIDHANEEIKAFVLNKLCNPLIVDYLLFDIHGNYVLQKLVKIADEPRQQAYFEMIGPKINNWKLWSYGLKWYNKWISLFPNLLLYSNINEGNNFCNIGFRNNHLEHDSIIANNNAIHNLPTTVSKENLYIFNSNKTQGITFDQMKPNYNQLKTNNLNIRESNYYSGSSPCVNRVPNNNYINFKYNFITDNRDNKNDQIGILPKCVNYPTSNSTQGNNWYSIYNNNNYNNYNNNILNVPQFNNSISVNNINISTTFNGYLPQRQYKSWNANNHNNTNTLTQNKPMY